ncbi:MAG: 50S ribosomal protein L6 [Candidatus Levybacteria bacterium]|nr:50S ribosomal protein L6 [Candidatus Levybacteria bacterium]
MSNIGKQPIQIEAGVTVLKDGKNVTVNGTKGTLSWSVPMGIDIEIVDDKVIVKKEHEARYLEKFYGLTRSLIANMVTGVSKGFDRRLELSGVGYRARVDGRDLVLNLGFSHPVKVSAPENIAFKVEENIITISGIDKQIVGDIASKIRKVRPPDPYKAKGIKYEGEKVRRKAGKTAKAA